MLEHTSYMNMTGINYVLIAFIFMGVAGVIYHFVFNDAKKENCRLETALKVAQNNQNSAVEELVNLREKFLNLEKEIREAQGKIKEWRFVSGKRIG